MCQCDSDSCDDIPLVAADIALWELNRTALGRGIANAFEVTPLDADVGVESARQVGSFGGGAMPIILTLPHDAIRLGRVVSELAARLRDPFILLAPTGRFMESKSLEILKTARAGFFGLAALLSLLENGKLSSVRTGGQLFSYYLPTYAPGGDDTVNETEARRLFAIIRRFEDPPGTRLAPILKVFSLYFVKGLSRGEVAKRCNCVTSLITLRAKSIERALGSTRGALRTLAGHFERIEESLSDSRARSIHRKSALDGADDDEQ